MVNGKYGTEGNDRQTPRGSNSDQGGDIRSVAQALFNTGRTDVGNTGREQHQLSRKNKQQNNDSKRVAMKRKTGRLLLTWSMKTRRERHEVNRKTRSRKDV